MEVDLPAPNYMFYRWFMHFKPMICAVWYTCNFYKLFGLDLEWKVAKVTPKKCNLVWFCILKKDKSPKI